MRTPNLLPRLAAAATMALVLTACGGTDDVADVGGDTAGDQPISEQDPDMDDETTNDGSSDETSMPADDDVQHDGSVSQGEAEAVANAYLGLTEAEAEQQAQVDGRPYRVGARDGEQMMLTEDYVQGRITVTITDGLVTAATVEAVDGPVTAEA